MLVEEADIQHEDDKGFVPTLIQLSSTTKRPFVFVCNGILLLSLFSFSKLKSPKYLSHNYTYNFPFPCPSLSPSFQHFNYSLALLLFIYFSSLTHEYTEITPAIKQLREATGLCIINFAVSAAPAITYPLRLITATEGVLTDEQDVTNLVKWLRCDILYHLSILLFSIFYISSISSISSFLSLLYSFSSFSSLSSLLFMYYT